MLCTLGISPALQRVMVFESVLRGDVNRAVRTEVCAAGKAVNAARAARIWAPTLPIVVAGVQGGPAGAACRAELRQLGLTDAMLEVATAGSGGGIVGGGTKSWETRVCVTLIETGLRADDRQRVAARPADIDAGPDAVVTPGSRVTELVQEPDPLTAEEAERVLEAMSRHAGLRVLLCAGTLASGVDAGFYARAVQRCPSADVLIDTRGEPLLRALAVANAGGARRIAKLNCSEALATTGTKSAEEAVGVLHTAGATHVVLTDGPRAIHAFDGVAMRTWTPPQAAVVNTTGCGDCLAGVLAAELAEQKPLATALTNAIAASAASAETLLPSVFDPARANKLRASLE